MTEADLTGYGICMFLIFFGLLIYFNFDNWFVYIGAFLNFWGFVFLSVQLSENGYIGKSFFSLGLSFLITQLFWAKLKNIFLKIITLIFLAFSFVFFILSGLYTFYETYNNISLFLIIEQLLNFSIAIVTLIEFIRKSTKYKNN